MKKFPTNYNNIHNNGNINLNFCALNLFSLVAFAATDEDDDMYMYMYKTCKFV